MKWFLIVGVALLGALAGWVAGDFYGTTHARDLSGFVGSLLGAVVAGLIAPGTILYQSRHQRQVGKAIILDLLEVVNRAFANLEAAREKKPWPFPNGNSAVAEFDTLARFLRQIESVCGDLQSTVPGAAAIRMIIREEKPRLALMEDIGRNLVLYEKQGNLLDPAALDKMLFNPKLNEAVVELRHSLSKVERHMTSGIAERHLKR